MILLDTFALVELFDGTKKGEKVKQLIQEAGPDNVCISALSLFETGYTIERRAGWERAQEYVWSIQDFYRVIDIDRRNCLAAIGLKRHFKLPALDCLIYSTARSVNAKIVSGCKHFKAIADQDDVILL